MTKFAIYIYDGMTALDAVGPYDLVNRLPGAKAVFVADQERLVTTQGGMQIRADTAMSNSGGVDVLIMPGGGPDGLRDQLANDELMEWIQQTHNRTTYTTSVCTGSLILGAAGLLEGHTAATHWRARGQLAKYGATYVEDRVVRNGKVITSAGVSAGLDMALLLIELLAGRDIASAVQLSAQYCPEPHFTPVTPASATPEILALIDQLGP